MSTFQGNASQLVFFLNTFVETEIKLKSDFNITYVKIYKILKNRLFQNRFSSTAKNKIYKPPHKRALWFQIEIFSEFEVLSFFFLQFTFSKGNRAVEHNNIPET